MAARLAHNPKVAGSNPAPATIFTYKSAMKKQNPADNVQQRGIEELIPYARNSRTHSEAQVAQIAASIKEWGFTTAVLIDPDGGIIAGHGRVLAARKLGMTTVPVMVADGWTDAQKRAYIIADNKLALNSGWDDELLELELQELQGLDFDLDLIGFDADELAGLLQDGSEKINDIDDMSEFNETLNFIIECDDLVALAAIQRHFGVDSKKINATRIVGG